MEVIGCFFPPILLRIFPFVFSMLGELSIYKFSVFLYVLDSFCLRSNISVLFYKGLLTFLPNCSKKWQLVTKTKVIICSDWTENQCYSPKHWLLNSAEVKPLVLCCPKTKAYAKSKNKAAFFAILGKIKAPNDNFILKIGRNVISSLQNKTKITLYPKT